MNRVIIDIGYSGTKIKFNNKLLFLPSAIAYANDNGIAYGDDEVVEYGGINYVVGESAVYKNAFTTTDIKVKLKHDPIIIYTILKKLNLLEEAQKGNVSLTLTLALGDWKYEEQYRKAIEHFTINDIEFKFDDIKIIVQGGGAYTWYVKDKGITPDVASVIEIGYNTINFIVYENGVPAIGRSRGFAGHGVSSVIRKFASYLENTFQMPFSEAEAQKIFIKGKFIINGEEQEDVKTQIKTLRAEFVNTLFNSVLVSEKKTLSTSDVVILAGGGCYLLENVNMPKNVLFVPKPYEFSNIVSV